LGLILALPAYTGSMPGKAPVPEKGQTSSPQEPAEQVIIIRTAPKDAKGDQVTVGKKGEIQVPRSTEGSRFTASAPVSGDQTPAENVAPKEAEEPASKETDDDVEAKTAKTKKGKGANRAGDTGEPQSVTGSMKSGEARGASGSGEGMAVGGFPSNSPANVGGILGGGAPSGFRSTTIPTPLPINQGENQTPITPPSLPTAQLQALLDAQVSDAGVPGAILAVQTKDGVWIGAAGKADLDANVPMTPDMQVRLAGVTKVFTAALIMKLVEENKIALSDTVEKWLPALLAPGTVPFRAQITVAMLLNHTSGLYDYVGDPFFTDLMLSDPYYAWPSDSSYDEVIYWIYNSAFLPGTAFEYCNAGYYLLGKIAEAATDEPLEDAIRTRFFSPREMSRTALTRSGQKTGPYTRDYCWIDVDYYPTLVDTSQLVDTSGWDLSWDWTSGSGVSTAQDMLTWARALFGGKVVNAQSLSQMTTPKAPSTFGFGLEVFDSDPWFGEKMYGHGGENPGVLTRWLYYPDSGRTIFIALNRFDKFTPPQMDASLVADAILSGVSSILVNTTP